MVGIQSHAFISHGLWSLCWSQGAHVLVGPAGAQLSLPLLEMAPLTFRRSTFSSS